MPSMRTFGGLALATLVLVGCESATPMTPLSTMPTGTVESQLRQQQLRGATTGANPGTTGGGVTGRTDLDNLSAVRGTGGTGSSGANVSGMRTDGTVVRDNVGAPATQDQPAPARPRRKRTTAATPAADTKPAN